MQLAQRIGTWLGFAALVLGFALLGLNVSGTMAPAKPSVDAAVRTVPAQLDRQEALEASLKRRPGESTSAYAERLTASVHYRMVNAWPEGDSGVPLRENFVLYLRGIVGPGTDAYRELELIDHEAALRRGYGLCSQFSLAIDDVLREQGISSRIAALDGHVVAAAELDPGEEIVLDADYGTVIPHSVSTLERRPELVRPYYERVVRHADNTNSTPAETADKMEEIYAGPNTLVASGLQYLPTASFQELAYRLKWIVPLGLLVIGGSMLGLVAFARRRFQGSAFASDR